MTPTDQIPAGEENPVEENAAPQPAPDTAWSEEWSRCFPDWEKGEEQEAEDSALTPPRRERTRRQPVRRETRRSRTRGRRKQRRRQGIWIFLALLCAAVLLAAGTRYWERHSRRTLPWNPWNESDAEEQPRSTEISIPRWPSGQGVSFRVTEGHGESLTAQEVYRTVNPSVVTVLVNLNDVSASVGTGVIFSPDGYVLTNYHLVEGGRDCMAILDNGYRLGARYVAGDAESDLAVLKLETEGEDPLPAAVFGDSNRLIVGDPVYAIGNPLGLELRGTMTNGIVSAATRDVDIDGRVMTLIQTNAALNSGNSGGPLINEYGQVVGLNVAKMSSGRSTVAVEGLGFAIPSASMERLVNDLLSFGKVQPLPSMGIQVELSLKEAAEGVTGLRVLTVDPGSSAERAGIQPEDYLLAADGMEFVSSRDLLLIRNRHYVGEEMSVLLWRDGETIEVTLELGEAAS